MEIQPADKEGDSVDEGDDVESHRGAAATSYVEEKDTDAEMASATEHSNHEDIDSYAEIAESTEHADNGDVDVGATGHAENSIPMPELMDNSDDEDDAADPKNDAVSPKMDPKNDAADPKKAPPQIFQLTISLRDDWLHRGDALQDMDLQTYAEFIMREAKPIRGADMKKVLARPIFAFDAHYKLASGYMQVFRPSQRRWPVSTYQTACEKTLTKAKKTLSSKPFIAR